jgi:CHASE3 domain sensor protein
MGGDAPPPDFAANIDAALRKVETVKGLTGDNNEQQARIPDIEKGIKELAGRWNRTMTVRKDQGYDAARQIVQAGRNPGFTQTFRIRDL